MGSDAEAVTVGALPVGSLENKVALSVLSGRTLGHGNFTSRKSTLDFIPWVYLQVCTRLFTAGFFTKLTLESSL